MKSVHLDPTLWLALIMAIVPFLEHLVSDPFVTSKPLLAAAIGGGLAVLRIGVLYFKSAPPAPTVESLTSGPDYK